MFVTDGSRVDLKYVTKAANDWAKFFAKKIDAKAPKIKSKNIFIDPVLAKEHFSLMDLDSKLKHWINERIQQRVPFFYNGDIFLKITKILHPNNIEYHFAQSMEANIRNFELEGFNDKNIYISPYPVIFGLESEVAHNIMGRNYNIPAELSEVIDYFSQGVALEQWRATILNDLGISSETFSGCSAEILKKLQKNYCTTFRVLDIVFTKNSIDPNAQLSKEFNIPIEQSEDIIYKLSWEILNTNHFEGLFIFTHLMNTNQNDLELALPEYIKYVKRGFNGRQILEQKNPNEFLIKLYDRTEDYKTRNL